MGVVRRARYRLGQFQRSIRAENLTSNQQSEIQATLSELEFALFNRQSAADKQHAYTVMTTLKTAGYEEKDLLAAALLHDVGKTYGQMSWWDRSVVVLAEALTPSLAAKWSHGSGEGWSRPFVIKAKHADWGAEAAAKAGSRLLTVDLIRFHHQANPDRGHQTSNASMDSKFESCLALLSWADEAN